MARHAQAKSCTLRLTVTPGTMALTVEDDGNGLIGVNGARHGLGLAGMAERADDWRQPFPGWHSTRYEAKAAAAGRKPTYLTFRKV